MHRRPTESLQLASPQLASTMHACMQGTTGWACKPAGCAPMEGGSLLCRTRGTPAGGRRQQPGAVACLPSANACQLAAPAVENTVLYRPVSLGWARPGVTRPGSGGHRRSAGARWRNGEQGPLGRAARCGADSSASQFASGVGKTASCGGDLGHRPGQAPQSPADLRRSTPVPVRARLRYSRIHPGSCKPPGSLCSRPSRAGGSAGSCSWPAASTTD